MRAGEYSAHKLNSPRASFLHSLRGGGVINYIYAHRGANMSVKNSCFSQIKKKKQNDLIYKVVFWNFGCGGRCRGRCVIDIRRITLSRRAASSVSYKRVEHNFVLGRERERSEDRRRRRECIV